MINRNLFNNFNNEYNNDLDDDNYHQHEMSDQVYIIIFSIASILFTILCLCYLYNFKINTQISIENTKTIKINNDIFDSTKVYTPEVCIICLENFSLDESIGQLSCEHYYHTNCINDWFATKKYFCPYCKREDI